MSLHVFQQEQVDVAIYEVGEVAIGGAWDFANEI